MNVVGIPHSRCDPEIYVVEGFSIVSGGTRLEGEGCRYNSTGELNVGTASLRLTHA